MTDLCQLKIAGTRYYPSRLTVKPVVTSALGQFTADVSPHSINVKPDDIVEIWLPDSSAVLTKVFKGYLSDNLNRDKATDICTCEGIDYGVVLRERKFKKKYIADVEASDIVKDIINVVGLVQGDIDTTATTYQASLSTPLQFNDYAFQCLQKIANEAKSSEGKYGFDFWTDVDKKLYFLKRCKNDCSLQLDYGENVSKLSKRWIISSQRNKVTVIGKGLVYTPTDQDSYTEDTTSWVIDPLLGGALTADAGGQIAGDKWIHAAWINYLPPYPALSVFVLARENLNITVPDNHTMTLWFKCYPGSEWVWQVMEVDVWLQGGSMWTKVHEMTGEEMSTNWHEIICDLSQLSGTVTKVRIYGQIFDQQVQLEYGVDMLYFSSAGYVYTASAVIGRAKEIEYVDESLQSTDSCKKLAEALLARLRSPEIRLDATAIGYADWAPAGRRVRVVNAGSLFNGYYRLMEITFEVVDDFIATLQLSGQNSAGDWVGDPFDIAGAMLPQLTTVTSKLAGVSTGTKKEKVTFA